MASIIIPGHHEYRDIGGRAFISPIKIMNVKAVELNWRWPVKNIGSVTGYVNYWIELTHDMGFGRDTPWLVYEPGSPFNLGGPGPKGILYKGPQRGIFGATTPLEAQGFYALRGYYQISPGGNQGVVAGVTHDAPGKLSIPGGRASTGAKEFWTKMLRQFRRGLKFHLKVRLYAHDGTGPSFTLDRATDFHWESAGAKLLGEHRWEEIFEVEK